VPIATPASEITAISETKRSGAAPADSASRLDIRNAQTQVRSDADDAHLWGSRHGGSEQSVRPAWHKDQAFGLCDLIIILDCTRDAADLRALDEE